MLPRIAMSAASGHQHITALMPSVFGIAWRHCPVGHYEDYAQDAMLHLLRIQRVHHKPMGEPAPSGRKPIEPVAAAYFKRAARNCIFDSLRAYQRHTEHVDDGADALALVEFIPDPAASPEQIVIAAQRLEAITARLTQLQQQIFFLLTDGYQQNEIAETLALSTGYISQQVAEIRHAALAADRDDAEQLTLKF